MRSDDCWRSVNAVAGFIHCGVLAPFALGITHGGSVSGLIPGAERDFHTSVTHKATIGQSKQHVSLGLNFAFSSGKRIVSALDCILGGKLLHFQDGKQAGFAPWHELAVFLNGFGLGSIFGANFLQCRIGVFFSAGALERKLIPGFGKFFRLVRAGQFHQGKKLVPWKFFRSQGINFLSPFRLDGLQGFLFLLPVSVAACGADSLPLQRRNARP